MSKLTAIQIRKALPGRHADENGLYLLVKPSGTRSWVLRIVLNGRRRDFGLGSVSFDSPPPGMEVVPLGQRKVLSLQEARDKAREGRTYAKAGLDPSVEWAKLAKATPTFEEAARQFHDNNKAGWRNVKHAAQWLSTLEAYAFPAIGRELPERIDAPMIWGVLGPIWQTKPETARRVRQRIGTVLDYAKAHGWRSTDAPMRALAQIASKQTAKAGHFAAMPYAELPAFMARLSDAGPTAGRMALRFAVLTAARSGEVRGATWDEVDLDRAVWTIPAKRMKAGEAHSVPLSDAAVGVLREAQGFVSGRVGEPVFPGMKGKPLSDMTLAKALRVSGGAGVTVHGMRSAFRDWVAEMMPTVPGDVAEAALAHTIANKTEAAYRRAKYLDQRRELMAKWAEYLSGRSSNVIRMVS